jgi:effector-binding domain-containing protein
MSTIWRPGIRRAIGEIVATLSAHRIAASGPPGGVYANELFADEHGDATLFLPVISEVRPVGRVRPMSMPEAELAVLTHAGSHADLDRSYGALATYVSEHALAVDGLIRECYLVGPHDADDESAWRTEIGWPIFETRPTGNDERTREGHAEIDITRSGHYQREMGALRGSRRPYRALGNPSPATPVPRIAAIVGQPSPTRRRGLCLTWRSGELSGPDLEELGVDSRMTTVSTCLRGARAAHLTENVLVSRRVRRDIGWGFGWCAALDIEELGINVAPTIGVDDLRLQGWGFEPKGIVRLRGPGIGISKIPNRRSAQPARCASRSVRSPGTLSEVALSPQRSRRGRGVLSWPSREYRSDIEGLTQLES